MDEPLTYYTITSVGEGFYKEKGSKFIARAFPVSREADIKIRLDELRKEYFDARHHCYAYRLGIEQPLIRANDDGEPNHSAGDPILGQIKSFKLTNVLVVVVRYFGGTKLGVGGLIHAYKTATEDALKDLVLQEVFPQSRFSIDYTYEQTTTLERLVQAFALYDLERTFGEQCRIEASIRSTEKKHFEQLAIEAQIMVNWQDD